jgi:hypothetical protein
LGAFAPPSFNKQYEEEAGGKKQRTASTSRRRGCQGRVMMKERKGKGWSDFDARGGKPIYYIYTICVK